MDVLGSASFVLQNEALTQNRLAKDVNALASGLRVSSASDDPSGYTIHESLDTKVAGLQQSVTNVQTANNLLNVAEAALSNVTSILQRIRTLIVEANTDVSSQSDNQNIQSEIDQLLHEINTIASETNFNGLKLFTGQFQSGTLGQSLPGVSLGQITEVTPPFPNPATGQTGSNKAAAGGQFITPQVLTVGSFVPTFTVWSVISASPNMVDPDTGINVGNGVLLQEVAYSLQGGTFGPTPLFVDYTAVPANTPINGANISAPSGYPTEFSGQQIYNVNIAPLSAADVGEQAAFLTQNPQTAPVGTHPLTVNDGGEEGQTVSISLPGIDTNALNISNITVLNPEVSGVVNLGVFSYQVVVDGVSSSNNVAASYSEIQVDAALQQINTARAQIGAQTVALQQDANSDNVAIVNLTAASSNIRDANIGATVTDFTKQQILVNVGNSVLAQMETNATLLTALLLNSFAGLGAAQGQPTATISGGGLA
jgi:flagellin